MANRYTLDTLITLGANRIPSPDPADRSATKGYWAADLVSLIKDFDIELSLTCEGDPNGSVASFYVGRKIFDTINNDIYICTLSGTSETAVWLNYTQHIIDRVAISQAAIPNIITLAIGQSLIANWSVISVPSGWNKDGETSFINTLNSLNTGGSNVFINGASGGSYLSRRAYEAAQIRSGGTLPTGNYWVDDALSVKSAGPKLTEALTKIGTAGKTLNQVNALLWSQGESDAFAINYGDITGEDYYADLVWLKDTLFGSLTNLRRMLIRPIGRRSDATNVKYEDIRKAEKQLATNFPYQVLYGSETYDLAMRDETGVSDGVHRSGAAFTIEGARAAREVAGVFNLFTGNTYGPSITGVSYTSGNVVVTVVQDKGTALANRSGVAYSGTPIDITPASGSGPFSLVSSTGSNIPVSTVHITGANQITITPSSPILTYGNTLRYGYASLYGIDLNSIPYDNAANPLPLQASYSVGVDGVLSSIASMPNLVSFFSPESTYNTGSSSSGAAVWNKRGGSGGNARKDGTKPAPTYMADVSNVMSGAPVIPGWFFDGTSGQKLLVENALTGSSNFTLFVVATPDISYADSSTNNVLIGSSATPTASVPLFLIRQSSGELSTLQMYCGTNGTTVDYAHSNTPTVLTMRRNGATCHTWNEIGADNTLIVSGSPVIDVDTNPVYAIGNMPLHGTGSSDAGSTFRGAVHYVILFDVALSDAEVSQIQAALKNAVGI